MIERLQSEKSPEASGPRPWEDATVDEVTSLLEQQGITVGTVCYLEDNHAMVKITGIRSEDPETGKPTTVDIEVISPTDPDFQMPPSLPIRDLLQHKPRRASLQEAAATPAGMDERMRSGKNTYFSQEESDDGGM